MVARKLGRMGLGCLTLSLCFMLAFPDTAGAVKIVLDAGHGGYNPGAISPRGLMEKDVNLDITLRLRDRLEELGYEVALTRVSDVDISLQQRVIFATSVKGDLFVSIHANDYPDPSVSGSLVLYYDRDYPQAAYPPSKAMADLTPESKRLAELVADSLSKTAGIVNRGLVPSAAYVVRMGSMPSILVETAFLSNYEDEKRLSDPAFRQAVAMGIAEGIFLYRPTYILQEGDFRDLPSIHWAYQPVMKLKERGVVEGDGSRFYPNRPLTRAEFVVMLDRLNPLPEPDGQDLAACPNAGQADLAAAGDLRNCLPAPADLDETHWAYAVILKAVGAGLLKGYPDGTLKPDGTLTRGEAAVLIDRFWGEEREDELLGRAVEAFADAKNMKITGTAAFVDVPVTLWSAPAIYRLWSLGIIQGTTADTYEPDRPILRSEMAALLGRMIP